MFKGKAELETVLRNQRVDAREEFVERLSERVLANPPVTRRAWSRAAFAGAVATFILGSVASFGGLSYAASGAAGTYHTVKQVAVKHTLFVSVNKSSAAAQYAPKPKPKPKHHRRHQSAAGVAGLQSAVSKPTGTLPFTGLSLLTTLVVSLVLIATGLFLRRREREDH
jgi:peptidoglycan/LPS O-acetylase OafA/YrhL